MRTYMSSRTITLSASIILGLVCAVQVQATTEADLQSLLNQVTASMTAPTTNSATPTTTTKTTSAPKIVEEKLNYTTTVPDRTIKLDEIVSVSLRSQAAPTTPIDIYLLSFNQSGDPLKKVSIKTVYNQKTGVTKRYKLMFNQDLLNTVKGATYVQIGYCIGGCGGTARSKIIKGRIILPRTQPLSSNSSTI